jgi:hypothetical protein
MPTDAPYAIRLLRARRERPRRRASNERHDLAPIQPMLHAVPASLGRRAGYRIQGGQSGGS